MAGVVVGGVIGSGGCSSSDQINATEITVAAASSLTEVMQEIGQEYSKRNPSIKVTLSLAGSSALAAQIRSGVPADLFASADWHHLEQLQDLGLIAGNATVLSRNQLVLVTPPDNPEQVTGLRDLARTELLVGLCAPEVPCGKWAEQLLEQAGVEPNPDTLEPNVRALRTKIAAGELDVGIVYQTDIFSGEPLTVIPIPAYLQPLIEYPIGVVAATTHPEAARELVEFTQSITAREILSRWGFALP